MTETFTRAQERPANTKAFAIDTELLAGRTVAETYNAYPDFEQSIQMQRMCTMYANAYSETMVTRLLQEQPDFFEDKPWSKAGFITHLSNNVCLPLAKSHSVVFRDTTAKIIEKRHTTDVIRRLNNGGDRFHPYL